MIYKLYIIFCRIYILYLRQQYLYYLPSEQFTGHLAASVGPLFL